MTPLRSDCRGIGLAESLSAILLVSLGMIALYQMFGSVPGSVSGPRMVHRARMAFLVSQIARETVEELRHLPLDRRPDGLWERLLADPSDHPWAEPQPVSGHLMAMTSLILDGTAEWSDEALARSDEVLADPALLYPESYDAIERALTFSTVETNPRALRVEVAFRWFEKGVRQPTPVSAVFEALLIEEAAPELDLALEEVGGE